VAEYGRQNEDRAALIIFWKDYAFTFFIHDRDKDTWTMKI
jgi:hypothetical protein